MPNIKMRLKVGGTFIQLYPETVLAQITDSTEVGRNVLGIVDPGVDSFIKIDGEGNVTTRTLEQVRTDLNAAVEGHPHTTGDITGLDEALGAKADLNEAGTEIISTQIPSFITGGLKYKGTMPSTLLNAAWCTPL